MRLFLDTSVRWLIAAGLFLGAYANYRAAGTINFGWAPINVFVALIIVLALLFITGNLVDRTYRILLLLNCWCDPEQVEKWIAELNSPDLKRRMLALRTMSDYLGRNVGAFEDWPFPWYNAAEFEGQVVIVRSLWEAKQAIVADCPSQERLLQRLGGNMKRSFRRLRLWPQVSNLPHWTARVVTRLLEYFRRSASVPAADGFRRTDCQSVLQEPVSLPQTLPPLDPDRLIEAMQTPILETLQKSAQILNDAPAGSQIAASEEPVGELLAQMFLEAYQIGMLLRMERFEANCSASPSQTEVWNLEVRGFQHLKSAFRHFEQLVERAGDAVKEILLDWNLLAEEVRAEPTGEDLPLMSPDEFVMAMRPHVEQAFKQFVEITNQTPTGLILVAEEAGVCRIFARLHAKSLETGLELRLRKAESLALAGKSREEEIATPHLRKAASPPLPRPLMGWAEKYRCMRIAGTRFPLLRRAQSASAEAPAPQKPEN